MYFVVLVRSYVQTRMKNTKNDRVEDLMMCSLSGRTSEEGDGDGVCVHTSVCRMQNGDGRENTIIAKDFEQKVHAK